MENKRLRVAAWLIVILLGFLHAWAGRHAIDADGVSYLDVADKYLAGDWHSALNGYWSPLYSWLLGLGLLLFRPTPYWEYPLVHLVNLCVYLVAFGCFEFFLSQMVQVSASPATSRGEREISFPTWAWYIVGCVLFLWSTLFLIALSTVTPDMCVAALVFAASGILLKIRLDPYTWHRYVVFGLLLGLGYLSKAVMFPLAFLYLAACLFSGAAPLKIAPRIVVAAAAFLLVSSPFLVALHQLKGRWTFGDSGRLAYAWLVDKPDVAYLHWRGQLPGSGTPAHPITRIFQAPDAYEFKNPMKVTYPPWYDASYWNEGLTPRFNPRGQLRVLGGVALVYYAVFINSPIGIAVLVTFLVLLLYSGNRFRRWLASVKGWALLVPSIGALALYALVHAEPRYIGAFALVIWVVLFSGIRLQNESSSWRVMAAAVLALALASMTVIVAKSIVPAYATVRDVIRGEDRLHAAPYWSVADGLARMGVRSGDQVGFIGYGFAAGSFWARLAKVRIIADIGTGPGDFPSKPDVDEFWHAEPAVKERVLAAFARTGAKAIVANRIPAGHSDPGWQRVGSTDHFVYFLR